MQIRQRETLSHQRTLPPWSLFIISSIFVLRQKLKTTIQKFEEKSREIMVRKKVDQQCSCRQCSAVTTKFKMERIYGRFFILIFFLHFWRAKLTYVEFLLKWAKKNYWNKTRLSQNCKWWILLVRVLRLEVCVLDFSDASRVENSIFEESRLLKYNFCFIM